MKIRLPTPSPQELALAGVTALWGGTFLILHLAMQHCGPMFFVGVRFLMAAAMVACLAGRHMTGLTRKEVRSGILIGIALSIGYVLQSAGLREVTSSRSAFITALYVPLVPLFQWAILRKSPHIMSWVGIGLAFAGLIALAGPAALTLTFSHGDLLTVLSACAIAAEIVLISLFAQGVDSRRITVCQLVGGGFFALLLMPVAGEHVPTFSWIWVVCAAALGSLSALVQLVMNWAQKSVPPSKAAVIYAGEPVWGGLVGWLAGDQLQATTLLGAALIVCGVLASEMRPRWLVKRQQHLTENG
ncbi:DMT family transporter [Gluconobacter cerinus]|uniref:DMT family transporter n=1 Tax=Gluconobacter cerinus TaxID=38307 RepID=UPI001B8CB5AC|nr:DMT family transporter [Gluconobacter cerinus]MBS1040744.1 DMT family transporter [Gluconobacter cerinus]MBS1047333.1 DMT family transporter [Gluconobacter cerinus]MBS1071240.1 DMT family transporter [Gluconobacter cerinus]